MKYIEEYVKLFNIYKEKKEAKENLNTLFKEEELQIIREVQKEATTNPELQEFIKKLENLNPDESIRLLNEFKNKEELKTEQKEEEVISKTFGIDVSDINHKYLKNGKEIFYFYDLHLGRTVVLENKKEETLVEQLKKLQLENENYQQNDNIKNTHEILEQERNKDGIELRMIPINEVENHLDKITTLKEEETKKLNVLLKNAENLKIKFINIENLIGINEFGKILEVTYDKLNDKYSISEPTEAQYKEQDINTSDRLEEELPYEEQYSNLQNKYEDKPDILEVDNYEQLPQEIKDQIKVYNDYPELLEKMPTSEQERWKKYIELYRQYEEKKQAEDQKNNPPKKYIKKEKKTGYIDVLLLSIITGFIGGVLTTLTMLLIK